MKKVLLIVACLVFAGCSSDIKLTIEHKGAFYHKGENNGTAYLSRQAERRELTVFEHKAALANMK